MNALLAVVLTLIALSGLVVVMTREPVRQAIVLSVFGLLEAVAFFAVQAPDVAFSQIVVGGIALPAMLSLTISKIRTEQRVRQREEETAGEERT